MRIKETDNVLEASTTILKVHDPLDSFIVTLRMSPATVYGKEAIKREAI